MYDRASPPRRHVRNHTLHGTIVLLILTRQPQDLDSGSLEGEESILIPCMEIACKGEGTVSTGEQKLCVVHVVVAAPPCAVARWAAPAFACDTPPAHGGSVEVFLKYGRSPLTNRTCRAGAWPCILMAAAVTVGLLVWADRRMGLRYNMFNALLLYTHVSYIFKLRIISTR